MENDIMDTQQVTQPSNKRSASPSDEEPATKRPATSNYEEPGTKRTSLGPDTLRQGKKIVRIENDESLVAKGHEKKEYRVGGWTVMNAPIHRMEPKYQAVHAKFEEDEGEGTVSPTIRDIDGLDLGALSRKERVKFSSGQIKRMSLWLKVNKTHKVISRKADFEELLKDMGFTNSRISKEIQVLLRTKVRTRLSSLSDAMVRSGAVTTGKDKDGKDELSFADWTDAWNESEWTGSIEKPSL